MTKPAGIFQIARRLHQPALAIAIAGGPSMLMACSARQQHLQPADVRPLRYTEGAPGSVRGLRYAVTQASQRNAPVRLLTVHGMRENKVAFSEPWQEAIRSRLGLVRRDSLEEGPIPRNFDVTVFAGPEPWRSVGAPASILRVTRWVEPFAPTTDRLVVYELTWAPMRDVIKYRFLGCFESRNAPKALCRDTVPARPNEDRRAGINGAAKDGILVDGIADAAIVLSPLANVLRADLDHVLCRITTDVLRSGGVALADGQRDRPCDLSRLESRNFATADTTLTAASFFAVTHSLGSFFVLDAQARADSARASNVARASDSVRIRAELASRVLDNATVYMWANQVALLELARLTAVCRPRSGVAHPCPPRSISEDSAARLAGRVSAGAGSRRTYVAFNDVNDLLGFELPPYLQEGNHFGRLINVSVRNPSSGIPRIFRHPVDAHTRQSDNPAVIEAVVDSIAIPSSPSTARSSRAYAGLVGLHVGGPIGPSVGVGYLPAVACRPSTHCAESEGSMLFVLEPGINGGRASVGYAQMNGVMGAGWSARGTFLQRWRTATEPYVGAEVSAHILLFLGARLGVYRAIRDSAPNRTMVVFDVSLGY